MDYGSTKGGEGRGRVGDEGERQTEAEKRTILFIRTAEEQTQWVVGMIDKCRGQRERVR